MVIFLPDHAELIQMQKDALHEPEDKRPFLNSIPGEPALMEYGIAMNFPI